MMMLGTNDFDYPLPDERIAQQPLSQRDSSRLMVLRRRGGQVAHHSFSDLPSLLAGGDLLVLNDTRVIPAKFACSRPSGGRIEGLFLREESAGRWEVLLKGARRCKVGESLTLAGCESPVKLVLLERLGQGRCVLEVRPAAPAVEVLTEAGVTPLPPYIRRAGPDADAQDRRRYQTVYANPPGAVAAPTAGLHFTEDLLAGLEVAGIQTARVTLHVGLGTFAPVKTDRLSEHQIHQEWYELSPAAAEFVNSARRQGRRVIAVGTTAVRVLETIAVDQQIDRRSDEMLPTSGWTDLFLYPPAEFRATDALITNFHLPRSTLLMLAAAFCQPGQTGGVRMILDAYAQAVRNEYRFYSYGDAMLIE